MINELIIGISQALDAEFSEAEIHTEEIKQGLQAPCFFIMLLEPKEEKVIGNRYYREQSFDVHYFPKTNSNFECNQVTDKLMDILEYIRVKSGLVKGTKMNSEVIDGVLHFFVNYNFYIYKQQVEVPYMQQLKVKGKVRDSGRF